MTLLYILWGVSILIALYLGAIYLVATFWSNK